MCLEKLNRKFYAAFENIEKKEGRRKEAVRVRLKIFQKAK